MKILVFYQYFCTPKGSWGTRWYELARRWVKQGHQVKIITSIYDKSDLVPRGFVTQFDIEGIQVSALNIQLSNKHGFLRRLFSFFVFAITSCYYALFSSYDVVISSSGPITVGLPGLVGRLIRRKPWLFEVRDLWPEGAIQLKILKSPLAIFLARFFEKICYHKANQVVVLSPGMKDWIGRPFPHLQLTVVPNGSDLELAESVSPHKPPEWAENKKLLMYTGTLGLIDQVGQLLDWATWLSDAGMDQYQIVIIGDGKERAEIEQKCQSSRLKNVHLLGMLPKTEVFSWLKQAYLSIFVVKDTPFLATASPNKVFDAFAVGVPIIQTTQGWIKALLDQEKGGITIQPYNAIALLDTLKHLEHDPNFYALLCENSKRLGKTIFNRDELAQGYLALLEGMIPPARQKREG